MTIASLRRLLPAAFLLAAHFAAPAALARVTGIQVLSRTAIAGNPAYGIPPSEKIIARVHFAVSPTDPHNRAVVDLALAPRNPQGEVEFSADLFLLRPTQQSNGALLIEIPNRGGKGILPLIDGGKADPATPVDLGDAWLLQQGFTFASLGWQWDAIDTPGAMRLYAPVATQPDGKPIEGLLRSDFTPWADTPDEPLGHIMGTRLGAAEYPAAAPDDPRNTLTVRDSPSAARTLIPRAQWSFTHLVSGQPTPSDRFIHLQGGFQKGRIYELVYVVRNPVVAGLGFAAVRDFAAYMKHTPIQPDAHPLRVAYAAGISQCGRFLREFLYDGFNADESGQIALDGILAHVGGAGRGSFNLRFAQPSRDAQPTSSIDYPTDIFPFTDEPESDPWHPAAPPASILDRARRDHVLPKIFLSHTSYEYWGRAASLLHTTADARRDLPPSPNLRIYFFTGLQHFSVPFPPARMGEDRASQNLPSPLPVRGFWRAMVFNLNAWVQSNTPPPPSRYPTLATHTLTPLAALKFPAIPGITLPSDISTGANLNFGPNWRAGILTHQPPIVAKPYPTLVPQVDSDGNDLGGIALPEITVPLATYTGWNLRAPEIGLPTARQAFLGSFLPLPLTPADAAAHHDPRTPILTRYHEYADYRTRFADALDQLIAARYLLPDERDPLLARSQQEWTWITTQK